MKVEHEHQNAEDEIVFYTIYRIYFKHKCHKKPHILPSFFIAVNWNTKQTTGCSYKKRNTDKTEKRLNQSAECAF
jgi:hypothetical protein